MTGRGPRKTRFDMTERARLRAALIRYMKEHGIGVPTLQVRIADGTDRSPDLLPLKTLQRFLADVGRTNDTFLIPCFEFAQSLPAGGDIEGFAREAAGFFGVGGARGGSKQPAGNYSVFTRSPQDAADDNIVARLESEANADFSVLHSRCVMELNDPEGPCSLREEVILSSPDDETETAGSRHVYEGVVLAFHPLLFALSRNILTRLPRAYWLRELADGSLEGHGTEARFLEAMSEIQPYTDTVDFRFQPEAPEERN